MDKSPTAATSVLPAGPRRSVLWVSQSPLLLADIRRDELGGILSASVVNGGWELRVKDGVGEAWGRGCVTSGIDLSKAIEVPVPENMRGDYNHVIASCKP